MSEVGVWMLWLMVTYEPLPNWVVSAAPGLTGRTISPLTSATVTSEVPVALGELFTHV